VLIGFFLPWFRIDVAAEAQKLMGAMQQSVAHALGADPSSFPMPNMNTTMKVNGVNVMPQQGGVLIVTGGDVGSGLGWMILVLALCAAAIPYVATGLRRDTRWKAMLAAVALALVIGIYLVTEMPRAVSIGVPVVLVGLVLEGVAVIREREPVIGHAFPVVTPLAV
jgi:hypothetical protein